MKDKLESLYKYYVVHNDYMKTNIEEVLSNVLNNANEINPIIISVNLESVTCLLDYIISNMEIEYIDDKLRLIVYEVLIDMYIYTKVELGNMIDFNRSAVTVDVDLQNNKLINRYIRDSKVLIDYSNEYIKLLSSFYNVHEELLNKVDIRDDAEVVYVGMLGNHIANILII
jgi:hypothetical protein